MPSFWRVFGIRLLGYLIARLLAGVLSIRGRDLRPPGRVQQLRQHDPDRRRAPQHVHGRAHRPGDGVAATLTGPFLAGMVTLLYVDRRIRAEALDVQLQQAAANQPASGSTAFLVLPHMAVTRQGAQDAARQRAGQARLPAAHDRRGGSARCGGSCTRSPGSGTAAASHTGGSAATDRPPRLPRRSWWWLVRLAGRPECTRHPRGHSAALNLGSESTADDHRTDAPSASRPNGLWARGRTRAAPGDRPRPRGARARRPATGPHRVRARRRGRTRRCRRAPRCCARQPTGSPRSGTAARLATRRGLPPAHRDRPGRPLRPPSCVRPNLRRWRP